MGKLKLRLSKEQKKIVNSIITRAPRNEEEVKRFFYKMEDVLGFKNVHVFVEFPDSTAFFGEKEIDLEFEYKSSNFKKHGHNEKLCDLIICWEDDDSSLKIPVLELSTIAKNWLKARKNAISESMMFSMLRNTKKKTDLVIKQEKIQILMDTYNFDFIDALAQWMGLTRQGVEHYTSLLGEEPECLGGKLTCEQRDLEPKHLGIIPNMRKLIPVVLCKDCKNRKKCKLGKEAQIGYFFILKTDEKRPKKVGIQYMPLKDKKVLKHLKKTSHNIWKTIRFKRR